MSSMSSVCGLGYNNHMDVWMLYIIQIHVNIHSNTSAFSCIHMFGMTLYDVFTNSICCFCNHLWYNLSGNIICRILKDLRSLYHSPSLSPAKDLWSTSFDHTWCHVLFGKNKYQIESPMKYKRSRIGRFNFSRNASIENERHHKFHWSIERWKIKL